MRERPNIPHSRPTFGAAEEQAVRDVLRSGRLAQGPEVEQFERELGHWFQGLGGVAVSSGTVAIELALRALGVGEGDEVIMPSYVCAALWHATTRVGARPVLADIEGERFGLDPAAVRRALTARTKALLVPHLFGLPANVTALEQLGVPIVEDCAQTLGALEAGRPVGTVGQVAVCSFYATKLLGAGEGGMVLSRDERLLAHVRRLRQYDEDEVLTTGASNCKMSDLHAAIARCQLTRLPDLLTRRRAIAARYREAWAGLPVQLPAVPAGCTHSYFRFVVTARDGRADSDAAGLLMAQAARQGVQCRRPIFQPLHRYLGLEGFPETERAFRTALSVPLYPSLNDEEVHRVITCLQGVCHEVV